MGDIETCFQHRLLNGGSGSPFRLRLSKHDHCKMSQNAAGIVRPARLCKDRAWYWWAHLIGRACLCYTHMHVGLRSRFTYSVGLRTCAYNAGQWILMTGLEYWGGLRFVVKRIFRGMNRMDVN